MAHPHRSASGARARSSCSLAAMLIALATLAFLPASALADPGAALVTGPMRARERAIVREALEDELRQAGWTLRHLADDEAAVLAACFARAQPWPCLAPLAASHHLARLVELRVEREASRRGRKPLRLTGQLGHVDSGSLVVDARYCSPCSDLQLATATRQLARRLLTGSSQRDASTRLEIRTTPPGAVLRIDGRMVEAPDGSVALSPGLHTVHLQLTGYRTEMRAITLEAGKRALLEIELTPLPSRLHPPATSPSPDDAPPARDDGLADDDLAPDHPPASSTIEEVDPRVMPPLDDRPRSPAPPPAERSARAPSSPRAPRPVIPAPSALRRTSGATWALSLGGAALLLVGGVLIALDEDLPEGPSQLHRPRYFDSATAGLSLAAAGALASATGLTLWLLAPSPSAASTSAAPGGAGLRYTTTF